MGGAHLVIYDIIDRFPYNERNASKYIKELSPDAYHILLSLFNYDVKCETKAKSYIANLLHCVARFYFLPLCMYLEYFL